MLEDPQTAASKLGSELESIMTNSSLMSSVVIHERIHVSSFRAIGIDDPDYLRTLATTTSCTCGNVSYLLCYRLQR